MKLYISIMIWFGYLRALNGHHCLQGLTNHIIVVEQRGVEPNPIISRLSDVYDNYLLLGIRIGVAYHGISDQFLRNFPAHINPRHNERRFHHSCIRSPSGHLRSHSLDGGTRRSNHCIQQPTRSIRCVLQL